MSNRGHEAHSPPVLAAAAVVHEEPAPEEPAHEKHERPSHDQPANTNASAFVETWPDGDAQLFARALARVLVRQALRQQEIQLDDVGPPVALAG